MDTGIIEHAGNKWGYQIFNFTPYVLYLGEIGFALFDSFGIVNSYIAWKNHILKGKPTKERKYVKFGIREARLSLIERWGKRAMRHYKPTQPHKKKASTFGKHIKIGCINLYCELKANAMRPDAKYHDEPCRMSFEGTRNCTICPKTTRWMCWGCNIELGEVFPVCSPSTWRNCFEEMHKLRTEIWDWMF